MLKIYGEWKVSMHEPTGGTTSRGVTKTNHEHLRFWKVWRTVLLVCDRADAEKEKIGEYFFEDEAFDVYATKEEAEAVRDAMNASEEVKGDHEEK